MKIKHIQARIKLKIAEERWHFCTHSHQSLSSKFLLYIFTISRKDEYQQCDLVSPFLFGTSELNPGKKSIKTLALYKYIYSNLQGEAKAFTVLAGNGKCTNYNQILSPYIK